MTNQYRQGSYNQGWKPHPSIGQEQAGQVNKMLGGRVSTEGYYVCIHLLMGVGAQLQSIHRGQVATTEMIVEMYDTPPAHMWTVDEFHNVVAWPEEPVHGGGAGAAEASARDMEEDEAEEEDAFDDDEDEEEEEDTEDSSDS
ncbi:hypothetical protein LR48_Vigan03g100200 [Vigna angularis]|uniref:Uncharacterized protein n=1 Tax=Phaseolus angularis TaxID=3914 RepID=A0A0L9U4A7_PHAAN|nr:hypothetical protein LR48_Vigan03g100200 [Vigna angularis]